MNIANLRKAWKAGCDDVTCACPADDITVSDGDVFAEHVECEGGYRLSVARFQDAHQFTTQIDTMLNGNIDKTFYSVDEHRWTWGEHEPDETTEILEKGIAPSERCKKVYEELRDEVEGVIGMSVPLERCRSARRKRKPAWAGGNVNVAKYIETQQSGKIQPCFSGLSKRADRPVVRIGVRVSLSCGNGGEAFGNIAAAAAVLCDKLETLGYGVEIHGLCMSEYRGHRHMVEPTGEPCSSLWKKHGCWAATTWMLKTADEPIDVQRIMSQGMSGVQRGYNFAALTLIHGGLTAGGCSVDSPDEVVKTLGYDIIIEKSWSRSNKSANAARICGIVKDLLSPSI